MDNDTKNRLTDLVLDATATTLQGLICPACDGGIDIQFVPKGLRGKGVGALYVTCPQCMWRVIADGLRTEPPWVRELGPKVRTAKNKVVEIATTRE